MELVLKEKCWDKLSFVCGIDDCDYINSLPCLFVLYSLRVGSPDPQKIIFFEIDGVFFT
jgi:hypothetical protein